MDIADRPKPFEIADSLLEMAQDVEIGHADRLGVPAASFLRECADCISRQADEIERLRAALRDIAEDDIYLRNCATWHDTGKMKTGVQAFARAALENK